MDKLKSSNLSKVLLIGDVNDNLLESLLGNENSTLKRKNELLLDTKYYVARLKLVSLKTVEKINEWKASTRNVNVGAIVYNYDGEFRSMEQLKQQMSTWRAEIQVTVCKRLERSADWSENLYRFCADEQIELVELDPDAETIEELSGYHELYGVPRIKQILEAGNWSDKTMKLNPLESNEQRDFKKIDLPINKPAKKSSKNSFGDEEFGSDDCDMTNEEKEMILKLFGRPKVLFDSLIKDADVPDRAVIDYFKLEVEKFKKQNKVAANVSFPKYCSLTSYPQRRGEKKKSKVTTANEFGEFVGARDLMSSNVLTQNSSNTKNEQIGVDIHMHREQESSVGNCKKSPESPKKDSYKLNSVSQSMIDGLFEKSVDEQGTNLVNKIHAVIFHFL
ncbi:hypothetical protein WUBG_12459 [Wuchereria bancrofti]|uniref:Uncharacterized protein n=1 Tax=Wuchereria bancrofti TaxID=6293 RepID=J9E320_WUCBA|nr:hypothetical protein WUBG_12459 [Wuchereria bancrofti]